MNKNDRKMPQQGEHKPAANPQEQQQQQQNRDKDRSSGLRQDDNDLQRNRDDKQRDDKQR